MTVFAKLNLGTHRRIAIFDPPESFEPEIASLADVTVDRNPAPAKPVQFVLAFATRFDEVARLADFVSTFAEGDAIVWLAYPKGTSRRYRAEFNRDTGWAALAEAGFEPVRQVAIDEDWSALRFRRRQFIARKS